MKVYVVYNFGQYNHLIYRMLRDLNVETKLISNTTPVGELVDLDGLVIGGGPSLDRTGNCAEYVKMLEIPILGICLGHQLIAKTFGGKVGKGKIGGFAEVTIRIIKSDPLFDGLPKEIKVWASHNDEVKEVTNELNILAESEICKIEALKHKKRPIYGLQWHPEVYHTEYGKDIYKNFIEICKR